MYRSLPYVATGMLLTLGTLVLSPAAVVTAGLLLLAAASLIAAWAFRCPRCRLHIDSQGRSGYAVGYVPAAECPRCGRSRRGVWPLQFLLRPESNRRG
jgi:hypothetical protein